MEAQRQKGAGATHRCRPTSKLPFLSTTTASMQRAVASVSTPVGSLADLGSGAGCSRSRAEARASFCALRSPDVIRMSSDELFSSKSSFDSVSDRGSDRLDLGSLEALAQDAVRVNSVGAVARSWGSSMLRCLATTSSLLARGIGDTNAVEPPPASTRCG